MNLSAKSNSSHLPTFHFVHGDPLRGGCRAGLGGPPVPLHVSREDLASAGKLALVEALLRFEGPPEQARAYCYVRVRGAVLDELRRLGSAVALHPHPGDPRPPRGRRPSNSAGTVGLRRPLRWRSSRDSPWTPLLTLRRLAVRRSRARSMRPTRTASGSYTIPDVDAECPARSAESVDTNALVQAALERLAPNHAYVLRRYYLDDATLEDIAGELGVSKERVRQIREAAEKKLREDFIVLALWQSVLNRN